MEGLKKTAFQRAYTSKDANLMAYVIMAAVENPIKLHVWKKSWKAFHPGKCNFISEFEQTTVKLELGQAICMRGDLIYAGNY